MAYTFDFIIVGGGTAGLVLANRLLACNSNITVCVVEAGSVRDNDIKMDSPSGSGFLIGNPDYDWNLKSVPQSGANNCIYHVPRGKVVGGSAAINFMAYGRPERTDVDEWTDDAAASHWSWDELLPYYERNEDFQPPPDHAGTIDPTECPFSERNHGYSGPITTSFPSWHFPVESHLLQALDEVSGLERPDEPCGGTHRGFFRSLCTVKRDGKPTRSHAGRECLANLAPNPHFHLFDNMLATSIVFDNGSTNSLLAKGIQTQSASGACQVMYVRHEVILCGGSIHTPVLLEQSGVGDANILKQANIPCLMGNHWVGSGLQDHALTAIVYELDGKETSLDTCKSDPEFLAEHRRMYDEEFSGALSGCVNLMGYISLPGRDRADIQIVGAPGTCDVKAGRSDCNKMLGGGARPGHGPCYSLVISAMYPRSRGSVHINPESPQGPPRIDLGLLACSEDIRVTVAGMKFADNVFRNDKVSSKFSRRVEPPPELNLGNDEDVHAYVRDHVTTYHHAVGTCAMGKVVDYRLQLLGCQALRVVDASVIPRQMSAPPMATVYAIAEKAADMILEDYEIKCGDGSKAKS